jgi:L-threonylcarbamoyladenylate synthase
VAAALQARFGGPITATSANLAGQPAATSAARVAAIFGAAVPIVVGGEAGGAAASTVARVDRDGKVTLLRAGPLDLGAWL